MFAKNKLVNEETELCYFGHICQENSTPIFFANICVQGVMIVVCI